MTARIPYDGAGCKTVVTLLELFKFWREEGQTLEVEADGGELRKQGSSRPVGWRDEDADADESNRQVEHFAINACRTR